ncbi:hypothetical protein MLD38_022915 [Melastoma candidum]|uniref:Uncharacterized protein n=1 Tax=Melastoma candidum TaxID=119954 RepID=A0ACB9QPA0_9MYRT|nr:hypothetical protein MLD38_022915 [Melastoma candidum]
MIKRTVSRNQRSKSAKLKHVLQILLLLCICFWLLYQIKRSHDRKRDMLENDSKGLVKGNDDGGGLNLGRKDLRAKHREEEDEEEGKDEDEGSQGERDDVQVDEDEIRREIERNEERERRESQKDDRDEEAVDNHEEEDDGEEDEEDSNKMEEVEDEKQGDNDDVSEAREEGAEVESIDHEEDILDEGKGGREESALDGGEEDIVEGREEKVVEDDRSEDKDQDEVGENSHEAREVHYRADDASSAVAHNAEAGNGDADIGSNILGTESNSTMSNPHSLILEATPGNQTEGKSNISEVVDNQASNVTASGGTELAGLVSNVSDSLTSLPQAGNLTAPDSGNAEVSLEQAIVVKLSNASADEKTANVSAMIKSSNQTDTTPSTFNKESDKPVDPSHNQTIAVSEGLTGMDKKQEVDDGSKASSSGDGNDNVIKMQLPDKQGGGSREKSHTQ